MISSRRMIYLQTLLKREDEELTKRILRAQISDDCPGDFYKLVESDFEAIKITFDLNFVENAGVEVYKAIIKKKVKAAALKQLKQVQQTHSKLKHIMYDDLKPQPYLTSPLFSKDETKLLFELRTRTLENCKVNFRNKYNGQVDCPLKCCGNGDIPLEDSQQHLLECVKLRGKVTTADAACKNVRYEHIFGSTKEQKEAIVLFSRLLCEKEKIL